MKKHFLILICGVTSAYAHWGHIENQSSRANSTLASEITLEQNIANCPYPVTEGYMTFGQREQFNTCLKSYETVESILEIGLNAGHSAENFFQQCPDLKRFVSVDICHHPYTPYAITYFQKKYKERFIPVIGSSLEKIPEYADLNPDTKFDLIFIDGNHNQFYCLGDIINCRLVAHENTRLWVDDYNVEEVGHVADAVHTAVEMNLIAIDQVHEDPFEHRVWIEAHYIFPQEQD